jgi:hypothetical protein
VIIYRAEDRGKGYGREAVELLTGWLFGNCGAERVQAGTDAGNTAMRVVLDGVDSSSRGSCAGTGRDDLLRCPPCFRGCAGVLLLSARQGWQVRGAGQLLGFVSGFGFAGVRSAGGTLRGWPP